VVAGGGGIVTSGSVSGRVEKGSVLGVIERNRGGGFSGRCERLIDGNKKTFFVLGGM